jgi:hypothetical protein
LGHDNRRRGSSTATVEIGRLPLRRPEGLIEIESTRNCDNSKRSYGCHRESGRWPREIDKLLQSLHVLLSAYPSQATTENSVELGRQGSTVLMILRDFGKQVLGAGAQDILAKRVGEVPQCV